MKDKEKYRLLCAKEISIPVYSRDWWLDCVCGDKNWNVLLYEKGDEIEAAMPFFMPCKGIITMPEYTQTMGIWFNPQMENPIYSKNLHRKQQICTYFIEHLPPHDYFLQQFHFSFTDWLPFYWKNFRQTTRYTYLLPDLTQLSGIYNRLSHDVKKNIEKAQKKHALAIKRDVSIEEFMRIYSQTFERQRLKAYCPETLQKLIETACARNQGAIWGARDSQGHLHSAVFMVWQENCAYYIAAGNDPQKRASEAGIYLLWTIITEAANYSASFDFEGSMLPGVERLFRSMGGVQTPYFVLEKGKMSLLKKIRRKFWF